MALSQSNNHKFASGELVTATKLNNVKVVQTDTATNNANFVGAAGQLTYDTTGNKLIVHDGATAGGTEVASGGSGSVTTNSIANSAVTSTQLATDAVTTTKVVNNAITTDKIANDAVTSDKIADDAVTVDMMHPDYLDPSGGLEFGSNGLKIATSSTALNVILRLNASTGIAYNSGVTHIARDADKKTVTDKFLTLYEAYLWLNENISSTGINIDIVMETNITESVSRPYYIRTTDDRLGTVRIYSQGLFDNKGTPSPTQITPPVHTINVDQNSSHSSRFIFWLGNTTTFRGIHIVANLGNKGGEYHSIFRALGARVSLIYCKLTVTSSVATNRIFEATNSGMIRVTSDMYASSVSGHEDPFTNGGRSHGLELDIVGISGGLAFVFAVAAQSAVELVEFRPGADRDLSGLHFSGNGNASFHRFCYIQGSSRIDVNTKISRSTVTTMLCPAVFDGYGYSTLTMGTYTEQGTTEYTNMPGTVAFDVAFTSPDDFVINVPFHASNQATGPVATTALDTEANYF